MEGTRKVIFFFLGGETTRRRSNFEAKKKPPSWSPWILFKHLRPLIQKTSLLGISHAGRNIPWGKIWFSAVEMVNILNEFTRVSEASQLVPDSGDMKLRRNGPPKSNLHKQNRQNVHSESQTHTKSVWLIHI